MQFSSAGFFPYPQEKRHNKLFFFFLNECEWEGKVGVAALFFLHASLSQKCL